MKDRVETDLIPHILFTNYKAINDMENIKNGYRKRTSGFGARVKKSPSSRKSK